MIKLHNKYYLLRHGEALSNVKNIVSSWPEMFENPLTEYGKEIIEESAKKLLDKHIDMIFSSDLLRTRQTAQIVGQALKLEPEFDTRLREISFGTMNGQPIIGLDVLFKKEGYRIEKTMPGGETYQQVLARVYDFLQETDNKYHGKHILIISHEGPLWMLEAKVLGMTLEEGLANIPREQRIHKGEVRELN